MTSCGSQLGPLITVNTAANLQYVIDAGIKKNNVTADLVTNLKCSLFFK